MKGSVLQEDMTILNVYTPNNVRQKLIELHRE